MVFIEAAIMLPGVRSILGLFKALSVISGVARMAASCMPLPRMCKRKYSAFVLVDYIHFMTFLECAGRDE